MATKPSSGLDGQNAKSSFQLPTPEQTQSMDDAVERIKKATPTKPYIMSVFSDPPFQHNSRTKNNWWKDTPFDLDEDDNIQYQTLLWRDPLETLFCLESTEDMEARRAGVSQLSSAPATRPTTPLPSTGAKKKISLAAYKNKTKQNGGTGSGQQAPTTKEGEPQEAAVKTPDMKLQDNNDIAPSSRSQNNKRTLDEAMKKETSPDLLDFSLDPSEDLLPSPKKQKLHNAAKPEQNQIEYSALPSLEGDTDKDFIKAKVDPSLPSAPTTVDGIVKPQSVSQPSENFLTQPAMENTSQQAIPQQDMPSWVLHTEDPSPDSLINTDATNPLLPKNGAIPPPHGQVQGLNNRSKSLDKTESPPVSTSSLTAKKSAAKPTSSKLNGISSAQKEDIATKKDIQAKPSSKEVDYTQKRKLSGSTSRDKDSSHRSGDQVASKRLPQPSPNPKPAIPSSSTSKPIVKHVKQNSSGSFFESMKPSSKTISPKLVPTSAQHKQSKLVKLKYGRQRKKAVERILQMKAVPTKAQDGTRRASNDAKDGNPERHKSEKRPRTDEGQAEETPVKRIKVGGETSDDRPRTPDIVNAGSPTGLTPSSSHTRDARHGLTGTQSLPAMMASPSSSMKASPQADDTVPIATWKAENSKLRALGKSVKKSSTDEFEAAGKEQDATKKTRLRKLAAVKGLESILCFMQAFSASDQYFSRKEALSQWKSLFPYANQVSGYCKEYSHLYGMVTLLRATVSSKILGLYSQMKPKDYEGSDEHSDTFAQMLQELENTKQLTIASEHNLPRSTMASDYPRTQALANKIPIGMITKPILAVRMASAFLEEWTTQQKIDWTAELEEGVCSQL